MLGHRVFGLDVLRALAVLIVVYGHGDHLKANSFFLNQLYKINSPIDGVTIFFVLSGFLIGHILLKIVSNGFFDVKSLFEFWIRRWFRTLPNYFLVLLCIIIFNYNAFDKDTIIKFVFFVQNLADPHPNVFLEAWSISVEEWFYLATPLFLFFLIKIKKVEHKKIILYWISTVILFSTLFRIYKTAHLMNFDIYLWDINIRKEVLTRLDSLMYGVLGAYLNRYYEKTWTIWATKCFILGIIMILWIIPTMNAVIPPNVFYNYILFTLSPLSVLLLIPKLSIWNNGPFLIKNIIVFISKISYSIYLIHFSLVMFTILPKVMNWIPFHLGGYQDIVRYLMYWGLTISISTLLYEYFEYPMMSLRDKFNFRNISFTTQGALINTEN